MMYKAVLHAGILYRSESWVVTDATMTALERLLHMIARRISGMMLQRGNFREREWSLVDVDLEVTGL